MSPRSQPKPGTRAQRRAEQRRQRRRLATIAVSVLLVLAAVVGLVLLTRGDGSGPTDGGARRTQRTVLFQVRGADGSAAASVLLVHDPRTGQGAGVLIPPQVLAQVPGVGIIPFGRSLQVGGVTGAANALADLLGITVDGGWALDGPSFQKLVDAQGGVSVGVDRDVVQGRTLLLSAGQQRLSGAQALTYATYLAPGEQEQTRQARLQTVLDAVIQGLPEDVGGTIAGLGTGAESTLAASTVREVLLGMKADDDKGNLQYRVLPVISASNDDTIVFRIDAVGARGLVDEVLAESVPPGVRASGNRVLVLNGVGTPGLGAVVREKLVPNGLVFVGSRNAPRFDYRLTQVLIKEPTPDAIALGNKVARALGVPESAVATSNQIGTIADVVVIIGADFKP